MAHCDEYIELISATLDGALSPDERTRLEEHLNACPACRALYDDLNRIHNVLRELPPIEVPAGLTDRIMEAVAADKVIPLAPTAKKKAPIRWQKWLATAAVLAVILAGAGTLRGQLNATKEAAAPGNFMPEFYSSEADEAAPIMTARTYEGAPNEDEPIPAEDQRTVSAPTDQMTDMVAPSSGAFTVQEAAKQSPASSPEVQTTGAQAPEPQPTEVPETTVAITGSLFVLPGESAEGVDVDNMERPEGQDAEFGKALSLTREAALSLLTEFLWPEGMPEGMVRLNIEQFFGYETPLAPVSDDPSNTQQASTRLEYLGLTPNGKYHEFWLHSFLLDDPETGLSHSSTINFFAVPLDGGEILTQRVEMPDSSEESLALYEAGLEAYSEAVNNS